jgi:hypothetical protein
MVTLNSRAIATGRRRLGHRTGGWRAIGMAWHGDRAGQQKRGCHRAERSHRLLLLTHGSEHQNSVSPVKNPLYPNRFAFSRLVE